MATTPGPSTHHLLAFEALPPPNASQDAENPPVVIPWPAGATLRAPPGFAVRPFAEGDFQRPRWLALAPNGDVFLTDADAGTLVVLRGVSPEGRVVERHVFAAGLKKPFGIAFLPGYVYVGNTNALVRFAYTDGQTQANGEPQTLLALPGRGYREHWTRNVVVSPDRAKLYVTIGSQSNVDPEDDPRRASVLEVDPDGSHARIFASGTRNPIGLAFHPTTKKLWAAVQERDRLGDDLVPDYVTELRDGGFYGWPWAYLGPHEDPRRKGERPDLVSKTIAPDVLVQAHAAILGLLFYEGSMFPSEWRGDALVAAHGSWNRTRRTGYSLFRIRFRDGRPIGGYDEFVSGWMLGEDQKEVWGRPVGVLELKDGSVLVTDDGAKRVWRITYSP